MPELPEVETICIGLRQGGFGQPSILERVIKDVRVYWPKSVQTHSPEELANRLVGQKIHHIRRRGKFILFDLDRYVLLFHLRMSGDLQVRNYSEPSLPHDRLDFVFQERDRLVFNDTRKFGRVWLVDHEEKVTGNLGPEPFDEKLTPEIFYEMLQSTSRQIKPLLLDQEFIAGLGNIYTDEALFLAKIHPLRRSDLIELVRADLLLTSIREVLWRGIHHHGASIDWVYRGGDFQNYFNVYRRTNLPCPVCQVPIQRLVIGQRSSHFCPKCQPYETA
jgi:formamidopyrimidine-DNA glycosylase